MAMGKYHEKEQRQVLNRTKWIVSFAFAAIVSIAVVVLTTTAAWKEQYGVMVYCAVLLGSLILVFVSLLGNVEYWLWLRGVNCVFYLVLSGLTLLIIIVCLAIIIVQFAKELKLDVERYRRKQLVIEMCWIMGFVLGIYVLLLGIYLPLFGLYQQAEPEEASLAPTESPHQYTADC